VVESAKDRIRDNVAEPVDGPSAGRILPERNVGPNLIVIGRVFREDSPKVLGVEHQQASRAAEFHHRALTEPYVSLSTHTAPSIQPFAYVERLCLSYAAPPITGWPPAQGRIPLPLRSSPITGLSALLRTAPSLCLASVN